MYTPNCLDVNSKEINGIEELGVRGNTAFLFCILLYLNFDKNAFMFYLYKKSFGKWGDNHIKIEVISANIFATEKKLPKIHHPYYPLPT